MPSLWLPATHTVELYYTFILLQPHWAAAAGTLRIGWCGCFTAHWLVAGGWLEHYALAGGWRLEHCALAGGKGNDWSIAALGGGAWT
jgi:hypothetical protein